MWNIWLWGILRCHCHFFLIRLNFRFRSRFLFLFHRWKLFALALRFFLPGFQVFLTALVFLNIRADKGNAFRAEHRIPPHKLHIPQADGPSAIINTVNFHAPPIDRKFHTDRDIISGVPFRNDLIGCVLSTLWARPCQNNTLTMFQELPQNRLPRLRTSSDIETSQALNISYQNISSQGGSRLARVTAIE